MVTILMMSAKLASPGHLKIKTFRNKAYDVIISDWTSPAKFYYATQIILLMWSYDQSLVTLASL